MAQPMSPVVVGLPYRYLYDLLSQRLVDEVAEGSVQLVEWSPKYPNATEVDPAQLDLVVLPYQTTSVDTTEDYINNEVLRSRCHLFSRARIVQALSIGVEGLDGCVPDGATLCNSRGVMELPTAELAVALVLSATRELPGFVRSAAAWDNHRTAGLLGSRLLLLGYGGVGNAVEQLFAGFPVEIGRAARRARTLPDGRYVHAIDDLAEILPSYDAVVCSLPETPETRGLIDGTLLSAMPDGTVFVNVGRGSVIDAAALRAEAATGRLQFALDVTDPEPLPADDLLWQLPNVFITPHVGGNSAASLRFQIELLAEQTTRLVEGDEPKNPVSLGQ